METKNTWQRVVCPHNTGLNISSVLHRHFTGGANVHIFVWMSLIQLFYIAYTGCV
jgi:hypothetical protein